MSSASLIWMDAQPMIEQRQHKAFRGDATGFLLRQAPAQTPAPHAETGFGPWEEWSQVSQSHQTGRPAVTVYYPDGSPRFEWWFAADEAHRVDGPAYVAYHKGGGRLERWYRHNKRHRTDGPAVIERNGDGFIMKTEWWIGGENVTALAEAFMVEIDSQWPFDPQQEAAFLQYVLDRTV